MAPTKQQMVTVDLGGHLVDVEQVASTTAIGWTPTST